MEKKTTVILGASPKSDRYAYKAQEKLLSQGYRVIPVNPAYKSILGIPCVGSLAEIHENVDTLTLYLGPGHLRPLIPAILNLKPKRVIFNPGTESKELQEALEKEGIDNINACTLVLLSTGQY
ncbi:MAG: CoA-binding protein [Spirochaetes bacterium GWB1_48_6]|nr:MAG: CoA-binding protein [Spirochaetes bacterium GWB1_48_6]